MILTCGEALFDMFARPSDTAAHGVAIEGVVGGSPLNVALGLARMGTDAGLFTRISTDMLGRRLTAFMDDNSVARDHCVGTDNPTTVSLIETGPDGHPLYSIYCNGTADCSMEPSDIPAALGDAVTAIHLGSFATVVEPTGETLRTFARREADRRFISFDPNVRTMVVSDLDLWRERIAEMLPLAGIVKASDEDLRLLWPDKPLEWFVEQALVAGADLVFVTRGPDGAIAASADGRLMHVPGAQVDVVDTVGAGDTFMAACLHHLSAVGALGRGSARNVDVGAMAAFAIRASALTCTRRGADLPTLAQIEAFAA
ncbi:carbohydrate kinase family protein [Roseitalea porphyridii]|uniref:Carbohydrate kinase n=1 Tax=Roseitalea porphyridii TaxID=1852022 RepID=A0A4P6UYM0_9HYPH|nr:carbohydrate kinase [Roseitalea porphyridii]QBK29306.1 carbohydrate kinase [Roseitalea porphyridii]